MRWAGALDDPVSNEVSPDPTISLDSDLRGRSVFSHSGGHGPVPRRGGDESMNRSKKQAHPMSLE